MNPSLAGMVAGAWGKNPVRTLPTWGPLDVIQVLEWADFQLKQSLLASPKERP